MHEGTVMNQIAKKIKKIWTHGIPAGNDAFYDDLLAHSKTFIKVFIAIVGLFNLALIAPDLINLNTLADQRRVVIMRGVFSLMALFLFFWVRKIKMYKRLALIITIYELTAVFVFFRIFFLYASPDFIIQMLGIFIINIVIFIVPNLWMNKVLLSVLIAAGFLLSADLILDIVPMHLAAGIAYLALEIVLCAVISFHFNRFQLGEYATKTELKRMQAIDPLTQVGNRIRLADDADKWIEFCSRYHLPLTLVLIDIDKMKLINDKYGHLAGDAILYEVAQIMKTQLRRSDVCTRWGGDEFILLLPYTDTTGAMHLVERMKQTIKRHEFNVDVEITCSYGIAIMKQKQSLEEMIRCADMSMYLAKKRGKNMTEISGLPDGQS